MFCNHCGTDIGTGMGLCPKCVAARNRRQLEEYKERNGKQKTLRAGDATVYAGFWLRFVALMIDSSIVNLGIGLFGLLLQAVFGIVISELFLRYISRALERANNSSSLLIGSATGVVALFLTLIATSIVWGWVYYALFESSKFQATPGKILLKLYVTDDQGLPVSFARASGRFFAKSAFQVPLLIGVLFLSLGGRNQATGWIFLCFAVLSVAVGIGGYILAGITARKQALHDILANCLVSRREIVSIPYVLGMAFLAIVFCILTNMLFPHSSKTSPYQRMNTYHYGH